MVSDFVFVCKINEVEKRTPLAAVSLALCSVWNPLVLTQKRSLLRERLWPVSEVRGLLGSADQAAPVVVGSRRQA